MDGDEQEEAASASGSEVGWVGEVNSSTQSAKLYVCDFPDCTWTFKHKSYMNKHKKIHSNARQYVCDFPGCNSSFNRKAHLENHTFKHKLPLNKSIFKFYRQEEEMCNLNSK